MEVLDEDTSSPPAMASAPLLGRSVCANCNEEIVDKYLLKVKETNKQIKKLFSRFHIRLCIFPPIVFAVLRRRLSTNSDSASPPNSSHLCFRLTTCAGMCAVSPAACARPRLAATRAATSRRRRFSANWITSGMRAHLLKCCRFHSTVGENPNYWKNNNNKKKKPLTKIRPVLHVT